MKERKVNYRIFTHANETVAVSSFAGKPVRGVARCADGDNFDAEYGKNLAICRCDAKIARKRLKRATQKMRALQEYMEFVQKEYDKTMAYVTDAKSEFVRAKDLLNCLESAYKAPQQQ